VSYILDALRKAERERHVSPVPTLDAAHESPAPAGRHAWTWALASALVVSAATIYGLWGLWAPGPPDPVRQALAPPAPVAGAASPAKAVPSEGAPSLSSARRDQGPGQATVAPTGRPSVAREPVEPPVGVPIRTPAKAPDAPRPADSARKGPEEGAGIRTPTADQTRPPPPGALAGSAVGEQRPPDTPPGAPVVPAVPPALAAPPTAALPPPPAPEAGRAGRVTPPGPSDALARLSLDVLVYSDVPAERLVFINGRKYVEGQAVSEDAVVEQITPDGAILRQAGQRIVLRPKLNPYARPGSP
jgi:general secretion pathway protein B